MRRREQVYDISKHPVRYFFDQTWEATKVIGSLVKRFALVGLLFWGGQKYLSQNGKRPASEGLKAKLQQVNNSSIMKNFYEGVDIIKEATHVPTPEEREAEQRRMDEVRKNWNDFREECIRNGMDPVMKYAKPGDPEYAQALKDYQELMRNSR